MALLAATRRSAPDRQRAAATMASSIEAVQVITKLPVVLKLLHVELEERSKSWAVDSKI